MSARLRGQRISRAELIKEGRDVLEAAGVRNHSRAVLLSRATSEVIASDNPLFAQLRPRVGRRDGEPWARAYALVLQYLTERGFGVTLDTAAVENGAALAGRGGAPSPSDEQLSAAIGAAPPKRSVAQILAARQKSTPKRPPPLVLPDIEPPRDRSPSPRSVLDYDALNIVKSATRTSPVPPEREEERP
jgi:hypothetical protein